MSFKEVSHLGMSLGAGWRGHETRNEEGKKKGFIRFNR
jgi:hypothetical protein